MDPAFRDVDPTEAERLVREAAVRVLDVRTAEEYQDLGHIPGALLLPVDFIPSAPGVLPRDDKPLLVCCEHGVRSAFAARFLARAGFRNVLNLTGGMSAWRGPRERGPADAKTLAGPSSWLVENADLLPRRGLALDVACGRGRHALVLAAVGLTVRAVDRNQEKVEALRLTADRLGLAVEAEAVDLEAGTDLGRSAYDLVVVVHYLHRPLFPALLRALKRGGILLYETFTVDQAALGKPTNPAFLLKPGELKELVGPLRILRSRQGEFEGRRVAGVVAQKA